jgi:serine/threonine protein kinase
MFSTSDDSLLRALAGRFTVSRALGRGGMGTFYLAHDRGLGRDVAIKVLNADVSSAVGI